MWRRSLLVQITGPTVLVSLLLLGLCVGAAVYLYKEQFASAEDLSEDVRSARAAHDLENTLIDLVALLRVGDEKADTLHQHLRQQLREVERRANRRREKALVAKLTESLERYFRHWETRTGPEAGKAGTSSIQPLTVLEQDALRLCGELQQFNVSQSEESVQSHRTSVRWMVAGLAGLGCAGALVGIWLGYGVAKALRRSIYHLSVRVQDAANKLGQDLPAVSLTADDDLHGLHAHMKGVVYEIEQVVEKLQQREHEVLRAEQLAAVGHLAAGVAHELRNPLTSIKMLVQTNREEAEARGVPADDLALIEQEVRRMERCLQTFLDFARPPRLERRPLDLGEVVKRTLTLIGGRARKQHVELRCTSLDVPVVVEADAEHLHQLLVNLALNALDVMPRGGTLGIDLRLDSASPDKEQVEVCVSDTGPGIAPEILPQLFQPFVSSKETGLGLGLVISRRIAESHGGSLHAADRPGGGACFTLRLPVLTKARVA